MTTHAVWKEEFRTGVVYYLRDDVVRGALLWNVWRKSTGPAFDPRGTDDERERTRILGTAFA
jgi:hypothetical protein